MKKIPLILYSLLGLLIFFSSCQRSTYAERGKKTRKARPVRVSDYSSSSKKTSKKNKKEVKNLAIRSQIVSKGKKYKGTPYKYGGKKPISGFDCSGFSTFVLRGSGIQVSGSSSQLSVMGKYVKKEHLAPGDLAFFGTDGKVTHVGIVVSNNKNHLKVIHSTSSKGVIISDIDASPYWKKKYLFGRDLISNYRDGITIVD